MSVRSARRLVLGSREYCFQSRATGLPSREPLLRLGAPCPCSTHALLPTSGARRRVVESLALDVARPSHCGSTSPQARGRASHSRKQHARRRGQRCFRLEGRRSSAEAVVPTASHAFPTPEAGRGTVGSMAASDCGDHASGRGQRCFQLQGSRTSTEAALPSGVACLSVSGRRSSLGRSSGASEWNQYTRGRGQRCF
jgi:hypothetical protein